MEERTILLTVLGVLSICLPAQGQPWSGSGIEGDPYLIEDANDMQAIGADPNYWDAHFKLVNDINLAQFTGTQFNIIGKEGKPFTGVFDGNGHIIRNFSYATTDRNGIGLFGYVGTAGEIRDLVLADISIDATNGQGVGGLAAVNKGIISNCSASGMVVGSMDVGGLVGQNDGGAISDCYATGNVSGSSWTGGLLGLNLSGKITHCYEAATVTGEGMLVGGLVGDNSMGTISSCYASGNVSGHALLGGGLAGGNNGTISNCYASGNVSGNYPSETGGLVGGNFGVILNSYATGEVVGTTQAGGLAGSNSDTIKNCYTAAIVSGAIDVGGLVGQDWGGSYVGCFWCTSLYPIWMTGVGNIDPDPNGVIGETITNMLKKSTYTDAGWDFVLEDENGTDDIWTIHEPKDFPKLVLNIVNFVGWYEVDFVDYAFFVNRWMDNNCGGSNDCDGCDLDFSDTVDINDLGIFTQYWLAGVE